MAKKSQEVAVSASESSIDILKDAYPVEAGSVRINLPRIEYVSQDKLEGKGKDKKVTVAAGTFFTSHETDETNDEGKKIWKKEEIGQEFSGIIFFKRKQLKMFDEKTQLFTNSPIYDHNDEIIPLFCNQSQIAKGTPDELKKKYEFEAPDGKTKSKLEEHRILYILYAGEFYQMDIRGSSMYSFLSYERKAIVPTVVTAFSSEAKVKGSNEWNQMTFEIERKISESEAGEVIAKVNEIKATIATMKSNFNKPDQLEAYVEESKKF